MKIQYVFTILAAMLFSNITTSQEGLPIYTDYLTDNYYLIHPSMAGAANCAKLRLTARQQWFGHEDAPKLLTMSVNSRIGETPSAVGAILYTDQNGYHSQTGVYATYAHHLMFSRSELDLNMLSFGLSVGMIQYKLDETSFLSDGPDPEIDGTIQSETNLNLDFGFSYQYLDYYAHGTVKNLIKNSGVNSDQNITSNLRRYLLSVGGVFGKYGSSWSYEPSVMLKYRDATKEAGIDINAKVYKAMEFGTIWGGISVRQSSDGAEYLTINNDTKSQKLQQITPLLGINFDEFMVAYTYTHQSNSLVFTNGGFHQFTLGYNFNCRKERYSCNCPAVN